MTSLEHQPRDDALSATNVHQSVVSNSERPKAEADDDIPAWRDADERLRMAVDAGSIGTWDFDPATGKLDWSGRCKALFGVAPHLEPTMELFLSSLHPDDR